MNRLSIGFGCVALLVGAASAQDTPAQPQETETQATPTRKKHRSPRVDISIFLGSYDLDEVEFDPDFGGFSPADLEVERDRFGARFAFGGQSARGYFQLFAEELGGDAFPGDEFQAFGIGGGIRGSPRANGSESEVGFLIPTTPDCPWSPARTTRWASTRRSSTSSSKGT